MRVDLKKAERDALTMFLALTSSPSVMEAVGLKFGGHEYQAALKMWKALHEVGPFDPDCDERAGQ